MKSITLLLVCSGIFLLSCDKKSLVSNHEIRQIIVKKYTKMRTTLKSGDPTYVLNMHADDAVLFCKMARKWLESLH